MLDTLTQTLKLDDDQRNCLFSLAGKPPTRGSRQSLQKIQPQLRRLLDDLATTPALVLGRRMDVIGWDRLASAMTTDFGAIPARQRNYVRIMFTDPTMRDLYADWATVARTAVAQLRMEAARFPDDPRLAVLVGELSMQDPQSPNGGQRAT